MGILHLASFTREFALSGTPRRIILGFELSLSIFRRTMAYLHGDVAEEEFDVFLGDLAVAVEVVAEGEDEDSYNLKTNSILCSSFE